MLPYLIAGVIGYGISKLFEDNKAPKYTDGGLIAPNGKPSNLTPEQYKLVRTPEFKAWFGDWEKSPETSSKVVDENGEPLVCYHGQPKFYYAYDENNKWKQYENEKINVFDKSLRKRFTHAEIGFYFSDKETAKQYAEKNGYVYEVFLKIMNPLINKDGVDFNINNKILVSNKLDKNDYNLLLVNNIDGLISFLNYGNYTRLNEIVAFNSNQIKLADGSNTTFDGNNPDIRFMAGGIVNDFDKIKFLINISNIYVVDYEYNIQYHSLYKELKTINNELGNWDSPKFNNEIDKYIKNRFFKEIKKRIILVDGKIRLFRALMLKNINDLKTDSLGIYWAYNYDSASVYDDENYQHKNLNIGNFEEYVIQADCNIQDIDWQSTLNIYIINEFNEAEIRVKKKSVAHNLKIQKKGYKKWKFIDSNNPDIRFERGGKPFDYPRSKVSRSKLFIPNVRGGWTKDKIIKYLKQRYSDTISTFRLVKYISEFENWEELKDHIYYHGTSNYVDKGLKPSITMSEREAERSGGGGYGERYFGISLTSSKRVAERFSGMYDSVSIYPVILKRDAKVIERTDLKDASEIEDIIVELYEQGVDAVWIGGGEQELVVVNPFSVLIYNKGRETHRVFGGFKSIPLTDEKIKEIYDNSLILAEKYSEEESKIENKEERKDYFRNLPTIQFMAGGQVLNLNKIRKGQYEAKSDKIEISLTNPKVLNGIGTNKWQLIIEYSNDIIVNQWFDTMNEALKTGAILLSDFLDSNNPDIRFMAGGKLADNIFDYLIKEKGFAPLGKGFWGKSNCTIKIDFSNVLYQQNGDNRVWLSPIEYSDYKKAFTILEFHCKDKNKGIGTALLKEIIQGADLFGYTIFIEPTSMKKYRVETDINTNDLKQWYSKYDFKPINDNYSDNVWLRNPNNPDIRFMAGGKVDVVDIKQYNIGKRNYRFVEIAEKKYNKIELYRQADDGNYYGQLLYRGVPRYNAEFSSPMVNDMNQLYAYEPVSNEELFNAVKNKTKPFASFGYWLSYYTEEEIQKEIQSFIDECDKYDLEYAVEKISGENKSLERIQFQVCQKGTFDELFDINALIEDYANNDFDSYDIEKLEEFRYVELSYFLNNEWDEHYALTGLILGIPPKFTMALINMWTSYGLRKKYQHTENIVVIKNNNTDIRFDGGGNLK